MCWLEGCPQQLGLGWLEGAVALHVALSADTGCVRAACLGKVIDLSDAARVMPS